MLVGKVLGVSLGWWHRPGLERQTGAGDVKEVEESTLVLKKSNSSLNILGSGQEASSALLLLFLSDVSSSWHLLFFSGRYSTAANFRFWDMVVLKAEVDMLIMLVPKEVREGMGRVATREERSVNWWPRLVRERLALDKVLEEVSSDLWWYNATGQQ